MAAQQEEKVLFERDGKVGIIRLNRPRVLNCLNPETLNQLRAHLQTARSEKKVRILLICGNGRAFSAGADLKYGKDKSAAELGEFNRIGLIETFSYLYQFPKPTIAVVDGILCMEGDGPIMGTPKPMGLLAVGLNPAAVDATLARITGFDPVRVPYLALAAGRLGPIADRDILQRGERWQELVDPFAIIDASHLQPMRAVSCC